MSIKLRELIRNVRACKTAAEERAVIAKECALIRTSFKEKVDTGFRHRNVAKLLFIHMLGYPTHFGQVESLKLIASPRFPEKRIGYLGLMILLDEKQEVLMLVTNCLKNDFSNPNPYVVGLALCSLGNIASADISRDLSGEVEKLFRSPNPYIRKKAALAAVRIVRKVPELVEDFVQASISLLGDKNHAVLLSGISLMIEMVMLEPKVLKEFRKQTGTVVRILKNMVLAGYVSEYDVCGITDPFLQCKILQLLRLLGTGSAEASDEMNDILAQVAINTESTKNPGNAILYECVQTIMSIEAEGGLRVLAINILGRFLLNRDNNIRYVALNTLCKVVQSDTQAIQRHRNTVVDCLKDADISIRRRALDLIKALVTKNNVRALVKELLNYLSLATGDVEFKTDLTEKICAVVDKYAPSKRWHIDTIISVLAAAGTYTRETVASNLITLISRAKSLHAYSAHKVYQALKTMKVFELPLVHVAVWCVGEYGEHLKTPSSLEKANIKGNNFALVPESEILDLFEELLKNPLSTQVTKAYVLNALLKLTGRFDQSQGRLRDMLVTYRTSMSVELQQRSVEYGVLFSNKLENVRAKIVIPMPMIDPKKGKKDDDGETKDEFSSDSETEPSDDDEETADNNGSAETEKGPSPVPTASPSQDKKDKREKTREKESSSKEDKPAAKTNGVKAGGADLLDVFGGGSSSTPAPSQPPKTAGGVGLDLLSDIFGDSTPSQPVARSSSNSNFNNDPLASLMGGPSSAPPPMMFGGGGFPVGPTPMAAPVSMDPLAMFMPPSSTSTPPSSSPFFSGPSPSASPPAPSSSPDPSQQKFPPLTAFEKSGMSITFQFRKPAADKTQILATFINSGASELSQFDFKIAVPKYLKLKLKPATSTVLGANGGKATQQIEIENTAQGQKKLLLRCKVDYAVDGNPVSEQFQVDNFPNGI